MLEPQTAPEPGCKSAHEPDLKQVVEGALLAAGGPLSVERLLSLYGEDEQPPRDAVLAALAALEQDYNGRGIEVMQVAGGYRIQVRAEVSPRVARLWDEKPSRYSRALLETLALIAYRQPITRGEIEDIRGVSVSTQIIRTLQERDWVRVVGHRDVPGRPALYTTTKTFLDYFGLKSLNELPPLAALREPADLLREHPSLAELAPPELDSGVHESGEQTDASEQPHPDPRPDNEAVGEPLGQPATDSEESPS
ncbi:SMC-Scp complex subunit ScpB [Thiorhodovibrio winogradskyi]|uniref:SMC-Scp complex subunit ScpB n=1 Tax=Thiorhodovibrio winogradskyi TaxID=77007 RepID=UPI002E2C70C1|nr:SMC-Scp complex subunit ScpB [Thiorhodovibrio winogradskyi]